MNQVVCTNQMIDSHKIAGAHPNKPFIVGIGGTVRTASSSEQAMRNALDVAKDLGAETAIITAAGLNLPMYDPYEPELTDDARHMIELVRKADGVFISSPGYHGGISGLLKNALDYLQVTANDPLPYLHNRAVGCIVTAAGWQAGVTTLTSLRSTVHALRGWPTPLGVMINSTLKPFGPDGSISDPKVADSLTNLSRQVVNFANANFRLCH